MLQKLQEMLELQDKLNTMTSGDKWREGITNKGKVINWRRCMYMEMAEAIDSVSWKHWKNIDGSVDFENLKVEMVDIWHFLMSELLRQYELEEVMEIIEENMDYEAEKQIPNPWKKENNAEIDMLLEPFEVFMGMALLPVDGDEFIESFVQAYFVALDAVAMDFDELYKLYIGKNVLNKFRQDHGYKEGTYIKVWDGKEDNVYMQEVIEKAAGFDEIYEKLEEIYKEKNT